MNKAKRELLRGKHNRHAKIKALYQQTAYGVTSTNPLDHLSPEELAKARKKVMEKLRAQQRQNLVKLLIIGVVLLCLASWLLSWVFG